MQPLRNTDGEPVTITEQDIIDGARDAWSDPDYHQNDWCNCVWDYALKRAGLTGGADEYKMVRGEFDPVVGDTPDTPRGQMMGDMLFWTHEDTARLVPFVDGRGILVVPEGGAGKFGGGVTVARGARINEGVRLGFRTTVSSDAEIEGDAQFGTGSFIGSGAEVGRGVIAGPGVFIGAGAEVGDDVRIGEGARVEFGAVVPGGTIIPADTVYRRDD